MTTIGYARVSTDSQTLDAQQAALREAGCTRVFSEKISGAKTDRQQLAKAIAALAEGDTLAFMLAGGFGLFLGAIWYIERRGNRVARRKAKQGRRKIKL